MEHFRKRYSVLLVIVLVGILIWLLLPNSHSPVVIINGLEIPVEAVSSPEELSLGLSGRYSLRADGGMLFIMPRKDIYSFWMKDMRFPIDIIWIAGAKVLSIEHSIQPETDDTNLKLYAPPEPVDHILEVNAGFSKKHNIEAGDTVIIRLK